MTKKADAWMPVYIGDYTGDTLRFSTEAHGAYFLLMMDYWRQGPPPDDDEVLATITKLPLARWRKHRQLIEPLFQIRQGRWHHKRIDAEREAAAGITSKRSEAGRKGAASKWQKVTHRDDREDDEKYGPPPDDPVATPMANVMANAKQNDAPSPSPSPSDSSELRSSESGAASAPPMQADLLEIPLGMVRTPDGDWSKPLFRQGLSWLASVYAKPPNAMRSFIGRCLQSAHGDHRRVFELVAQAQRDGIADPCAWIMAALQAGERQANEVESAIASIRKRYGG